MRKLWLVGLLLFNTMLTFAGPLGPSGPTSKLPSPGNSVAWCAYLENQLKTITVGEANCSEFTSNMNVNHCTFKGTSATTYSNFQSKCKQYYGKPAATSVKPPAPIPNADKSQVNYVPPGIYRLVQRKGTPPTPLEMCKQLISDLATASSHWIDCLPLAQFATALDCKKLTNDPIFWDVTEDYCRTHKP